MENKQSMKLLGYYDEQFWGYKVDETNWNYNGLILDCFFENSVLSIDFLNIQDYFDAKGFSYCENETLTRQYEELSAERMLELIQAILNILKVSHYDEDIAKKILNKTIRFLERYEVKVTTNSIDEIVLSEDNTIGEGAYCKVSVYARGQVKKELRDIYALDDKLIKRLRYEYENTKKLQPCPNIIRVFDFDEEENFYTMEIADMTLYDYLQGEIEITRDKQLKIIFDILRGVQYAHSQDIIHRDLHLGNILRIKQDFVISDFGWSKDLSVTRSLKSSDTEKNNHYFMDPFAAGDLTKMDKQTDIYAIGKIIEYMVSLSNNKDTYLDFVVVKCTARDKDNRYKSVDEIIIDIEGIIDAEKNIEEKKEIDFNISKGILTAKEASYISKLLSQEELCNYIVKHKLYNFSNIILQYNPVEQLKIMGVIDMGYAASTGYGHFENYDIYAQIAYQVYKKSTDIGIKRSAKSILEGCANIRWKANDLLQEIEKSII